MRLLIILTLITGLLITGYIMWPTDPVVAPVTTETKSEDDEVVPTLPSEVAEQINAKSDLIVVNEPEPLSTITSPLTVKGEARGYWFFEASFPIVVTDWDGRIIGEGFATADEDWMTEEFVPFTGTVEFTLPEETPYQRGTLIFKKDNPSGLPEHDDALEIPIKFE